MFFIWVILAGLLQITVLDDLNLLVTLAVFSGLRKGPLGGLLIGAVIGIFVEFLTESLFGLNLALYGMIGFLAGAVRLRLYYKENIFMDFMFSFCGVILFYSAHFVLTSRIEPDIFSRALFSAVVSPLLFRTIGGKFIQAKV